MEFLVENTRNLTEDKFMELDPETTNSTLGIGLDLNDNETDFTELCGKAANYEEVNEFYRWWILGIATSLLALLGIIGNIISLLILCSRSMSSMFNNLLACLCGADILFLVTNVLLAPVNLGLAYIDTGVYGYLFPWVESCSHFSLSLSIFLIVSITVERYQAVCYPHYYQVRAQNSGNSSLLRHIIPGVVLSLILNITRFLSISPLGLDLQSIPSYLKFLLFFQIFHPFTTTGIIPLVLLTTLNYKVYSHMSKTRYFHSNQRRTKDFSLAKVMTVLVVVFLGLNVPRLFLSFKEVTSIRTVEKCLDNGIFFNISEETYIADFIARLCAVLNSSINFIIYCMFGTEFRKQLFLKFGIGSLGRNGSRHGQTRVQSREPSEDQFNMLNRERQDQVTVDGTSVTRLQARADKQVNGKDVYLVTAETTVTNTSQTNGNTANINMNTKTPQSR
ncbi:FMRFamide receptor isoform X2 [Eurytemora carolleeae]|uniref:FMRFamide receptor isoform X2 n=1 Tax=Eurytemora carolleeae TaxID=1294199 RepID=UPI000C770AD4|nr:FMRFamide receptor isoform X2 [Eurytemora carolleeae]|eukprot:XP_023346074.1 FMRFamide receptor-like isoform X2 [Eurytemora affinis]